ncbi:MAG: hypothetical protein H0X17_14875 [Deltaproteobacteria bacterium]|nr:hypothetical protein [Deltaproteobacteria bacterium]
MLKKILAAVGVTLALIVGPTRGGADQADLAERRARAARELTPELVALLAELGVPLTPHRDQ